MLQNMVIKNFRCFRGFLFKPLARVNLIAGKNNTGKTALLEAIHLLHRPTDCSLPVAVNRFRGIEAPDSAMQEVCSWLFHDGDARNIIELTSCDTAGDMQTLSIGLLDATSSIAEFPGAQEALAANFRTDYWSAGAPRLILKLSSPGVADKVSVGLVRDQQMAWMSADVAKQQPCVYVASMNPTVAQDVRFFGEVELNKRQAEILPALRLLEGRLVSLSLIPLAGQAVIHGDIGLNRMVPIQMMGEGMRRLLSIVLAIANAAGGTVLIDEIENGLHYSVLEPVWQAIAEAAERSNVQVFATTHSFECIQAAHRAFKARTSGNGRHDDFAYHRLDRLNDDVVSHAFDDEMLDAVQASDLEIR